MDSSCSIRALGKTEPADSCSCKERWRTSPKRYAGEVAQRYRYRDGGVISASLMDRMATLWDGRSDRYSEIRAKAGQAEPRRPEMWQIGG